MAYEIHNAPRPRILLVEGEDTVRRSLQLLLQARGFDVRAHAGGAMLLAHADIVDMACFIVSYHIIDPDSAETLSALRRQGWHGPAVLIAAHSSPELQGWAQAEGFAAVIEMPLREEALADRIVRLIRA